MIIGHLPAGFLAARAIGLTGAMFAGFVIGSVVPDLDMLWFYLVDHGGHHHHGYLTHRPFLWVAVLLGGLVLRRWAVFAFGLGALLHMLLDSIAGRINWGWPFFDAPMTLVIVPATQSHWLLSFIFHWTFAVELIVLALAVALFLRDRRRKR